ncbi:MAG: hypothetical protein COT90_01880 [Candidatus Diapherotrites archaeon CG10_big_fil_rev_8_21_14_0_10_31_34]|nr:MAG: hypothetical protein COT90_01880 [Candidatus Diapherotrites archaeon CG10_big_fil_rev_8_21_14_0_10_31_34]PJA19692.1 MAG: hypothetical protein COX63_01355 [Candidatus Diapherotrites archaeon CG_4_10_14_0_2_um_filter_31_5]
MPGLNIKTNLFPYRLKLRNREPIRLDFTIANNGVKPKLVSFSLELPPQLGLDKAGMNRVIRKKLPNKMAPGETVKFSYDIFPSKVVETGEYTALLNVSEHFGNYDYELENKNEQVTIRVED